MMIYLLRHTQPLITRGVCYGQTDLELNPETKATDIENVIKNIEPLAFSVVYTSPLRRCRELAEMICRQRRLPPPIVDTRLMEMSFGEWEMRSWKDIFQSPKGKAWFADYLEKPTPHGESFLQIEQRAASFFAAVNRKDNTLIVSHDGFIRASLVWAGQLERCRAFEERYSYGEIKEIKI